MSKTKYARLLRPGDQFLDHGVVITVAAVSKTYASSRLVEVLYCTPNGSTIEVLPFCWNDRVKIVALKDGNK